MDAYEATRIVFSRIQTLDPENAPKIMGLLLIQDHGEKEMIRLAFGPEALLHSLVFKAKKELCLLPPSTPSTPSSPSPFLSTARPQAPPSQQQNSTSSSSSSRWLGLSFPHSLSMPSPTSWATASSFPLNGTSDDFHNSSDELISPNSSYPINHINLTAATAAASSSSSSSAFYGDHLMDEFQLQDQLSFLNDTSATASISIHSLPKSGDSFYSEADVPSPTNHDSMLFPYGNWGANGHRRSCSVTDIYLGSEAAVAAGAGFGWKPCLYFARGYCKNGTSCRFLHGLPDSPTAAAATDVVVEPCQELLLRSKSQRLGTSASHSQLMASASFPYSAGAGRCMNYLLQQQQNETTPRAVAALMLGEDTHKFSRSRMERSEFGAVGGGIVNPGSRQIYLTFPADSTFREEDVSNYFSIYGPVQDVRIPYQQKRMFGFVTFVHPETVKLILAKGNPHFVCDARVLVKPYKEKGKVPDKYRKQQQQVAERGDFSSCTTPSSLDSRDSCDMQMGTRMFYNSHEMMLRKLEEQPDLQQAIEIQGRRLMGLQLLDVKRNNLSSPLPSPSTDQHFAPTDRGSPEARSPPTDKCPSPAGIVSPVTTDQQLFRFHQIPFRKQADNNESADDTATKKERSKKDADFQESPSVEDNLPDNPFASPTKSLSDSPSIFSDTSGSIASSNNPVTSSSLFPTTSTLDMTSFKSCYFQLPRLSSGHGAIGM